MSDDEVDQRAASMRARARLQTYEVDFARFRSQRALKAFCAELRKLHAARTSYEIEILRTGDEYSDGEVGFWYKYSAVSQCVVLAIQAEHLSTTLPVEVIVTPSERRDMPEHLRTREAFRGPPDAAAQIASDIVISAMARIAALDATIICPGEARYLLDRGR